MRKLIYLFTILLLAWSCSNETEMLQEAALTQANAKPGCGKGNQPPCPPDPVVIPDMDTITFNGPEKINLVFVAEGFTAAEMGVFDSHVTTAINQIFTIEPFTSRQSDFNTFKWATASNDSGISILTHPLNPVTEVIKDTRWDFYKNAGGLARAVNIQYDVVVNMNGCDYAVEKDWIIRNYMIGDYDTPGHFLGATFVCFILNEPQYTGIASFTEWSGNNKAVEQIWPVPFNETCNQTLSWVFSGSQVGNQDITFGWAASGLDTDHSGNYFGFLVRHELLGHTIGDLDDEYYDAGIFEDSGEYWARLWYHDLKDNITDDPILNPKWDNWVANPQYISGGRYFPNGTTERYRSSSNSIMRSPSPTIQFNEVSKYIINQRLDSYLAEWPY